jgi:nitrite reductase (NADH) large subunit
MWTRSKRSLPSTDGDGCEICKPTVGSILSSLINENIMDGGRDIQETNDRSMANMQRGGTYSVVPRVPAGGLAESVVCVMGEVAKSTQQHTKVLVPVSNVYTQDE